MPRLTRLVKVGLMAGSSVMVVMTYAVPIAARATNAAGHPGSWTVYHGDAAGSGSSGVVGAVDTSAAAWTSPVLDGQLYGEPLVSSGDVFVATQNDTVYALSTSTGRVIWSTHVAPPVPASALACGDISPTVGITGTPVIDQSRNELFVVADELANGHPVHKLVGLNVSSGAIELAENVDPPGADAAALLQRTGLTLDAHQVVFAMGGNFGDCGSYRGTVVAVKESGATPTYFTVDAAAGESQGAIWMGGAAPAVDRKGNIWVSAGNGSVHSAGQPYDDSDSVLELSPSLRLVQFFAPTTWAQDNAQDQDLSTAPVLLADGQVLVTGKSPRALSAERRPPGWHRGPGGQPRVAVRRRHRRRECRGGRCGLPAVPEWYRSRAGHGRPSGAPDPVELTAGGRPTHRRRRSDLDHRAERQALRP